MDVSPTRRPGLGWPGALLLLFGAAAAAVLIAFLIPEPAGAAAVEHGRIPGMLRSGPDPGRSPWLRVAAWLFAACVLSALAVLFGFGLRRRGRTGPARWPVAVGALALNAAFAGLMLSQGNHEAAPSPGWILPAATEWMLFVFWPAQLVFVAAFVVLFDRWFWPPESAAAFEGLLAEGRRADRSGDPGADSGG